MIKISIVLLFFLSVTHLFAQDYLEIRKKIIPLQSSRSNVENIARFVKKFYDRTRYETDNEYIDIYYSEGNCKKSDWNVPIDRVITYISYPKNDIVFDDVIKELERLPYSSDDTARIYFVDELKGIKYVVNYSDRRIEEIRFIPLVSNENLRCKNSLDYKPVTENYNPRIFIVKNASEWDSGNLLGDLFHSKSSLNSISYIFVYCKKGQKSVCNQIIANINSYSKRFSEEIIGRVKVSFGGYRTENQVEIFVINNDQQPPLPRQSVF